MQTKSINKIAVIGAGIVGTPMAALLADAESNKKIGKPAKVVLIQRNSRTSGWKVEAINEGKSPINGIEPDLDRIIKKNVDNKLLRASHDYNELSNADVILLCVQTDKKGYEPDYGPLKQAMTSLAKVLKQNQTGRAPLIIFESTLAPTTMNTWIKDFFKSYSLIDGQNIFLGNSPNRVMPSRLIERIKTSDKLIGGLNPDTPKKIKSLYSQIVKEGTLFTTNSLTAEIVKTFENAYRDIRIAFSAEIARYCDSRNYDFYYVRDQVNKMLQWEDYASDDPSIIPSGGMLIPTIGVGGHCLPKDGILLLWRQIQNGLDLSTSLFSRAREINNASPGVVLSNMEQCFGSLSGKTIALLGTSYRPDSEDTRNSPTLELGQLLKKRGLQLILHDPFVKPTDFNLTQSGLKSFFVNDKEKAIDIADIIIYCTAHKAYLNDLSSPLIHKIKGKQVYDGCHLFSDISLSKDFHSIYGIGKGKVKPSKEMINFVLQSFQAVQKGTANELHSFIEFINENYAKKTFDRVSFKDIQNLAGTCITGCQIDNPAIVDFLPLFNDYFSNLAQCAFKFSQKHIKR